MTNRILAQYSYTSTTTSSFSFSFSATPAAGSRIVIVVEPGNPISTRTSGYTQDVTASSSEDLYVFSKIADGSETGFSFTVSANTSSVFAVAYERDDCPTVLFTGSGTTTSSTASADVDVPANVTTGFVVAAVTSGSRSSADPSWNQGLSLDAGLSGSNSTIIKVFFASGSSIPAAGTQTYTATGMSTGGFGLAFVVAGYGTIVDQIPVTSSDTASVSEGRAITASASRTDTATLAEAAVAEPGVTGADTAALGEQVAVAVLAADLGTLAETPAITASPAVLDAAVLDDTSLVEESPGPVTADTAALGETAALTGEVAAADTGALGEAAGVGARWVLDGQWTAGLPYTGWAASTPWTEWAADLPHR